MLRPKFKISSFLSSLATLITTPINHVNAACIEVPQDYVPGECSVAVMWHKITLYEIEYRESREGMITDWISANIRDPLNRQITNNVYVNCRGYPGMECVFNSGTPQQLVISPQHRREYLQFWFGDLGWNTDPEPMAGPTFVGEGAKDRRPYCGVYTDWKLLEYDGDDKKSYKDDPDRTVNTIHFHQTISMCATSKCNDSDSDNDKNKNEIIYFIEDGDEIIYFIEDGDEIVYFVEDRN
ncbi:hypothetical protein AOL_s00097g272 [Orbilia oligospora ATCC 24927]|uniref:Uncharacterized protein n=1 Tax=Arthrobotrys oligospora (strain ATCC 24927 / CBS 115.81 / DSM 1491) TaxID=756982 RepID=G1XIU5_ARTOA|nr:hypothetical protein AOL_s00097g272 [Orbilia oligospora ATCC 24927]EGX46846.1 hypothetical protein AOL_s00097g272 [Orbilia oligospora ATCC 24927]